MFVSGYVNERELKQVSEEFDYIIVGGGLTGVCSAIAAARAGVKVALIQDRPVLGGNASSEVRLWALGATSHMGNNNRWSREGGVIDELMVENTYRNKEGNPVLFDMTVMDKVLAEPNISLYLNTVVYEIEKSSQRVISSVKAFNSMNATHYTFTGKFFADCSGDGIVAYLAGASFRMGAEDKEEFNEGFAPDKNEYGELLGHSILFYMKDTGKPVKYVAPDFALKDVEKDIPKLQNPNYFNINQHGCKYWWLEYGGRLDTIGDTEQIKYELWKVVYGVWDYIKNSGKFPAMENYTLEWAGIIPGKRESRRFVGHYMINQKDVIEQHDHYDAVAYGGWSIDLHPSDGVYSPKNGCNQWHSKGIFQIPYRCYVTPDLDNLFIGGRIMSATHVANGSTRVMCTSAHGGQAFGVAAALCVKNGLKPADYIEKGNVEKLQAELVKLGQFIPNVETKDGRNLLEKAQISVSSEFVLDTLPEGSDSFKIEYPAAQLIPVKDKMPKITVKLTAKQDTVQRIELRSSTKPANFTPDVVDVVKEVKLTKGENIVEVDFDFTYPSPRYVFVCFMTNADVTIPFSDKLVSGIMSVFNYINPAVSNYGKQSPTEDIGVEEFEFWCPKRRPDGKNFAMQFSPAISCFGVDGLKNVYYRPYISVNGWIASDNDSAPTVSINWNEKVEVSSLRLFFDTDFDHAMENVQMGHHDSAMPFCIDSYTVYGGDELLFKQEANHQTMNNIVLEQPFTGNELKIVFDAPDGNCARALMGVIIE